MRKFLSLFLMACMSVGAFAYDVFIDGIYYDFHGKNATVTYRDQNYNSYSGEVVVPATVEYNGTEYTVTSIGNQAFDGCSSLTTITLPNSITSIGSYAFDGCSSLTSITLPNSITSIGSYTFSGCSSLTSITLPNSITSIGSRAFRGCFSLTTITLPNSITSIGSEAFTSPVLSVTVLGNKPASLGTNAFHENTIFFVLDVDAYKAAWKEYKFIFTQKEVSASVHLTALPDKSALQQKLGLDSLKKITSLRISGTINSYDIMMMRNQMPDLLDIDLSEANIVANDYEYTKGYHSKKDTLTAYSFTGTGTHIRKAILPNSVVCIEENVFNTPYLQEVVLPKNLRVIGDRTFFGCRAR